MGLVLHLHPKLKKMLVFRYRTVQENQESQFTSNKYTGESDEVRVSAQDFFQLLMTATRLVQLHIQMRSCLTRTTQVYLPATGAPSIHRCSHKTTSSTLMLLLGVFPRRSLNGTTLTSSHTASSTSSSTSTRQSCDYLPD